MLLDDIIDLAVDSKHSISTLLRKCVVLAHQLKNDKLKTWADQELNGYDSVESLPEYRVLPAQATGLFVGPGWARFTQDIPSLALEKEHRDFSAKVYVMQPIGVLEDTVGSGDARTLQYPWDANLVLYYRNKLTKGWQLFSAHQTVSTSEFTGIIETVRNRLLRVALDIQAEVGEKDEDLKMITPDEARKVDQTIVNNIYGGNVYVASGQSTMNATTVQQQNIVAGDWAHLEQALKGAGIATPELKELSAALKADGGKELKKEGRVAEWIKATAPKVLTGGVKIGTEIGKTILTQMLMQYYGLKS